MGVIYKAEDTSLQRPVALKFLSSNLAPGAYDDNSDNFPPTDIQCGRGL